MPLDWIAVIALIVFGLILIIVEVIFVPGTTVIGVFGFLLTVAGIWTSYATFGAATGHVVLGATFLAGAVAVFISFRSGVWRKLALNRKNKGRVNEDVSEELKIGETGVAVSALRPSGTARFHDSPYEVRTTGAFVSAGAHVRIIKISGHKIIVEPIL